MPNSKEIEEREINTNISRRKMLLSMGMAGAALATGGLTLFPATPAMALTGDFIQVPDIAALRTTTGTFDGEQAYVTSHSSSWIGAAGRGPTGGGMFTRIAVSALGGATDNNGTIIIVNSTVAWVRSDTTECRVEDFGAVPYYGEMIGYTNMLTDAVTNKAAIWAAIKSIRTHARSLLEDIGGVPITAYTSGRVVFGRGIYAVEPDSLEITQDVGLQLIGQGYRGSNNALRGATVLMFAGTSSGFGLRFHGNGSRTPLIQDMDVCYANANFTGDLIDTYNSPGLKLCRVYVGTSGIKADDEDEGSIIDADTRLQTARSGVRATYDEFNYFQNVTFDGLQDGWWSDDARGGTNTFGGSVTNFESCVFYDVRRLDDKGKNIGRMLRHDGNRTRTALCIKNTVFNPIKKDCGWAIRIDNVDGFHLDTCLFAGSTSCKATEEWVRITNSTGTIHSNSFNDFSKAGTLGGHLTVNGNTVYCTDGFTLIGGLVKSSNNEFTKGSTGYRVDPAYALTIELGPDLFKTSAVGVSYYINSDPAALSGKIIYAPEQDASPNKFINVSTKVTVASSSGHTIPVTAGSYSISILHTGRDFAYTANGAQSFDLPTPIEGTEIGIMVIGTGTKTITKPSGVGIIVGSGTTITSLSSTTPGSYIRFKAFGVSKWVAINRTDGWVLA